MRLSEEQCTGSSLLQMMVWDSHSRCQSQQQGQKTKAERIWGYEAATGDSVREMEDEETMRGHTEMWMLGGGRV